MEKIIAGREKLIKALNLAYDKVRNCFSDDDTDKFNSISYLIQSDVGSSFLSIDPEDIERVTYARNIKDKFIAKKRVKTSFRRFVRRQLGIDSKFCNDNLLDRFGSFVLSFLSDDISNRVKLLSGEEIVTFYSSTFTKTCMTGRENRKKIEFYAINSDKVKLAVLDNYIRAFVWQADGDKLVFDRVYPAGCDAVEVFRNWAKNNGYLLRANASGVVSLEETVEIFGENDISKNLFVTMKQAGYYPYLDTFRFGKLNDDNLILSNDKMFGDLSFTSTHGVFLKLEICIFCGGNVRKIFKSLEGICCEKCFRSRFVSCYNCGANKKNENLTPEEKFSFEMSGIFYCKRCLSFLVNNYKDDYSSYRQNYVYGGVNVYTNAPTMVAPITDVFSTNGYQIGRNR